MEHDSKNFKDTLTSLYGKNSENWIEILIIFGMHSNTPRNYGGKI